MALSARASCSACATLFVLCDCAGRPQPDDLHADTRQKQVRSGRCWLTSLLQACKLVRPMLVSVARQQVGARCVQSHSRQPPSVNQQQSEAGCAVVQILMLYVSVSFRSPTTSKYAITQQQTWCVMAMATAGAGRFLMYCCRTVVCCTESIESPSFLVTALVQR